MCRLNLTASVKIHRDIFVALCRWSAGLCFKCKMTGIVTNEVSAVAKLLRIATNISQNDRNYGTN